MYYFCPYVPCDAFFPTETQLNSHIRVHLENANVSYQAFSSPYENNHYFPQHVDDGTNVSGAGIVHESYASSGPQISTHFEDANAAHLAFRSPYDFSNYRTSQNVDYGTINSNTRLLPPSQNSFDPRMRAAFQNINAIHPAIRSPYDFNDYSGTQNFDYEASTPHAGLSYQSHSSVSANSSTADSASNFTSPPHDDQNSSQVSRTCSACDKTFTRRSDLKRHAKKHQPDMRIYHCDAARCSYRGSYRKDKLDQHIKNCH